jgi:prevent-host-death family protein
MHAWQLKEAKSRFSELVELTLKEGPQLVTRHGEEAVVIIAAKDYRHLTGQTPTLMDCLLHAPREEALEIERPKDGIRHLVL